MTQKLEEARKLYQTANADQKYVLEKLFPELAESEDERIRKAIIEHFSRGKEVELPELEEKYNTWIAWLEKQGKQESITLNDAHIIDSALNDYCCKQYDALHKENGGVLSFARLQHLAMDIYGWCKKQGGQPKKVSTWKHWKDGIAGGAEGKQIFLIKIGRVYSISSCLGCECDYIELSELDKLLSEKQGEQKFSDIDNKFLRMRETKPANIVEFLDRLTTVEQEFLWEHIEKVKKVDREEREQKPTIEMISAEESLGIDSATYNKIVDECIYGEQKPANKIEPIFNVGDKIQYSKGCGTIMTIEKIENGEYIFANNMGHTTIESGNKWYLVEQKPAWSEEKPTQEIEPFEAEHGKYYYCIKDYFCGGRKQASKGDVVQALRGLPIMGLKDASEYFLPVNFIKCNSTWIEKDETALTNIIIMLKEGASLHFIKNDIIKAVDWLKSLKERYTWKPSDEQMEALWEAYKGGEEQVALASLYSDLKKLKE